MKKLLSILVFSLLFSGGASAEITTLHCKFVLGDRTNPKIEYGIGDQQDEYLKIDFDKEKIVSAPYYENIFVSNPLFQIDKVTWHRTKKKSYSFFSELDRKTGQLNIIWNKLPSGTEAYSTEHIYECSKAEMKF